MTICWSLFLFFFHTFKAHFETVFFPLVCMGRQKPNKKKKKNHVKVIFHFLQIDMDLQLQFVFSLSPLNDTTQTPKWKTNKQNRRVTKGKCSSLSTINTHTNSNTVCHVSIKIQLHFENRLEWRFSNDVLDFLAMMMMSNSNHNGKQNKIEAKPKQSRRDCYWCLLFVCCAIEPWSISSAHLKGKCFSWMCKFFGFEF